MRPTGGDDGVTAVEFALVVLVILMIGLGAVDFGLWMFQKSEATQAAREASRVAMIDLPSELDGVAASKFVSVASGPLFEAALPQADANPPKFSVSVACSATPCVSGDEITVRVSWGHTLPFAGLTDTVSGSSTRTVVGLP